MLERGELSQITANAELADRLLATARQHLASARLLADTDPYLAYVAVYDAIREALSALLQIQGLRATTSGGHLAVMHAVQAQFGASMGAVLRPVDRIRVTPCKQALTWLARPAGFEPATRCLEATFEPSRDVA